MKKGFFKILIVMLFLLIIGPKTVLALDTYKVTVEATHNGRALRSEEVLITPKDGSANIDGVTNDSGIATFYLVNGEYTATIGYVEGNYSYYGEATFTVDGKAITVEVDVDSNFSFEAAEKVYNRTTNFNHVDIRVNGTLTSGTTINQTTHKITLANVVLVVTEDDSVDSDVIINKTFTDHKETYEWRVTNKKIPKTAVVNLKFDILIDGVTVRTGYTHTFKGKDEFIQAIINCDANQGLDFIIASEEIVEAAFYDVSYKWKVRDNGELTDLPTTLAISPQTTDGYATGDLHTIDTQWQEGSHVVYEDTIARKEYIYTFEGWDYWSHETDNNDKKNGVNSTELQINNDTIIYGEWTVTVNDLPQISNHLIINKTFEGNEILPDSLYFIVTEPGENPLSVEIPLSSFTLNNGVYTYSLPITKSGTYTITEYNYEIAGYDFLTQTTTETIDSDLSSEVSVTFTNTYTKRQNGNNQEYDFDDIHNLPSLTIEKSDSDNHAALAGAKFTLTNEAGTVITSESTTESGYTIFKNIPTGKYTLVEILAPLGYQMDTTEYLVEVTNARDNNGNIISRVVYDPNQNAYVMEYDYAIKITQKNHNDDIIDSEHFNATINRFTVFNKKLGELTISKEFGETSEFNKDNFDGEITIDVTGENYNNSVILNKSNNFSTTLSLVLGKYTIKERLDDAKVSGYDLVVDYGNSLDSKEVDLTKENLEEEVVITNTYSEIITYTEVSVEKVWDGKEDNNYPEEVEVGLYKDGNLEEKQTLSKENNWSYKWTNLVDKYKWTVDELTIIDGYTKSISQDENHFVITNKYTKVEETPKDENNNNEDNGNNQDSGSLENNNEDNGNNQDSGSLENNNEDNGNDQDGGSLENNNEIPLTADNSNLVLYVLITLLGFVGVVFTTRKRIN